jgi:hypothetical protein
MSALVWSAIASIVSRHGQAVGLADAGVVERDDAVVLGEGVDELRGPAVYRSAVAGDQQQRRTGPDRAVPDRAEAGVCGAHRS